MRCTSFDLDIDGVLSDPLILAVLRADHVDPRTFETLLRRTARDRSGADLAKAALRPARVERPEASRQG